MKNIIVFCLQKHFGCRYITNLNRRKVVVEEDSRNRLRTSELHALKMLRYRVLHIIDMSLGHPQSEKYNMHKFNSLDFP